MVALRILLVLSALMAPALGHTRGAAQVDEEQDFVARLSEHRAAARRLMKDKKVKNLAFGGDSKDQERKDEKKKANFQPDNKGVAENHACVPFNDEMQGRAGLTNSDDACLTNSCGGGCCRIYHWLICDEDNAMPQLSCVCNGNTIAPPSNPPTDPPTPFPTLPPTTPKPTPSPTPEVTTDVKAGSEITTKPVDTPLPTPEPTKATPSGGVTQAPFVGAASDSCASGSPHHNNALFKDFTRCFGASDCPLATECCIHSFCFCGEPDSWTGDCVSPTTDVSK